MADREAQYAEEWNPSRTREEPFQQKMNEQQKQVRKLHASLRSRQLKMVVRTDDHECCWAIFELVSWNNKARLLVTFDFVIHFGKLSFYNKTTREKSGIHTKTKKCSKIYYSITWISGIARGRGFFFT